MKTCEGGLLPSHVVPFRRTKGTLMGLDTTHDCWHGAYSSFAIWRSEIARAAARPTEHVEKYGHERHVIEKKYPPRVFMGWWDEAPDDPLDVLLVHSDCDGYIFPEHLEPLAKRLDEIKGRVHPDWRERTQEFIDGLRRAAERWEVVVFR